MASVAQVLENMVPVSQFSRGKASKIFDRLRDEKQLIVLKNNQVSAVILSPDEYYRLSEIEEDFHLLIEAEARLRENEGKPLISEKEALHELGITQEELDAAEELEIE